MYIVKGLNITGGNKGKVKISLPELFPLKTPSFISQREILPIISYVDWEIFDVYLTYSYRHRYSLILCSKSA